MDYLITNEVCLLEIQDWSGLRKKDEITFFTYHYKSLYTLKQYLKSSLDTCCIFSCNFTIPLKDKLHGLFPD